jgi:N-acetylglucosamine kinase-like BadF-type ATPase
MSVVLGIDGGGTKTECVAAGEDGALIGRGFGGPVNTNFVQAQTARRSLLDSIDGALGACPPDAGPVLRVVMGGPMRRALAEEVIGQRLPGVPLEMAGEGALVLAAGDALDAGIALIAGTGSMAYGVRASRDPATVGGWGTLMGDEGSAFDLGQEALRAVAHAADGRGPETALTEAVLGWAGVAAPRDLPSVVYRPEHPPDRTRIASLGEMVTRCADRGDFVAGLILERAADALFLHVRTLARILGFGMADSFVVVGSGGVLRARGRVLRSLTDLIASSYPQARVFVPRETAAAGGAVLALRAEGFWSAETKRRLLVAEEES